MNTPFDRFSDLLSVHPESNFPVISFKRAVLQVIHGNYRTLSNGTDVFLCLTDGKPLAIVDLDDSHAEVRHG